MLTGQASKALNACRSAQGELTPTPQTGPNSCPMIVVTPEASEASMMRGDEQVDVGVDGAGGGDQPLAGDDRGAGADDDVDPVEGVGVAGAADGGDAALADADRGLADAQHRRRSPRRC